MNYPALSAKGRKAKPKKEEHLDVTWEPLYTTQLPAASQPNAPGNPVAYRAWFDQDNGARWIFTLWPEEEHLDVIWEPLYVTQPPVLPTKEEK